MHLSLANGTLTCFKSIFFPQIQQQEGIYFQQVGVPAHYAHCICEWLEINFNDKWIGRCGPIEWPARSPDLSPMDFFLKTWCTKRNHKLFLTFAELLLTNLPQLIWNYAKRFVAVLLRDWFPVSNTTGNNLNCLNDLFVHCC